MAHYKLKETARCIFLCLNIPIDFQRGKLLPGARKSIAGISSMPMHLDSATAMIGLKCA